MTSLLLQSKATIRRQVLKRLLSALKKGSLSQEEASQAAKILLNTLEKTNSLTDLHTKLPELEFEIGVLGDAIEPILQEYTTKLQTSLEQAIVELASKKKISKLYEIAAIAFEEKTV